MTMTPAAVPLVSIPGQVFPVHPPQIQCLLPAVSLDFKWPPMVGPIISAMDIIPVMNATEAAL